MGARGSIKIPDYQLDRFEGLKIRLASDIGRIPNNPQYLIAMLDIAEEHYPELLDRVTKILKGER